MNDFDNMYYEQKTKKKPTHVKAIFLLLFFTVFVIVILYVFNILRGKIYFDKADPITCIYKDIYYSAKRYPRGLIELYKKNPETLEFINNYPNHTSNPESIDISKEVSQGQIPHFLQWDERWGYEQYGDGFIAVTGCAPTCLSMVYSGLTGKTDMNPYKMAKGAQEAGCYIMGAGSNWSIMDKYAFTIGLKAEHVKRNTESISKVLQTGQPIICSMGPGDFTRSGHFIVLTGITESGEATVNDPNSKIRSQKTWNIDNIVPQIKQLWCISAQE